MEASLELIDANEPHEIALANARIAAFSGRLRMDARRAFEPACELLWHD
jgi:hypothetical protein